MIASTAINALELYASGRKPVDTELASWLLSIQDNVNQINRTDPLLK